MTCSTISANIVGFFHHPNHNHHSHHHSVFRHRPSHKTEPQICIYFLLSNTHNMFLLGNIGLGAVKDTLWTFESNCHWGWEITTGLDPSPDLPIFLAKNAQCAWHTSLSQVPWRPEQKGWLQVPRARISHWLSWCDSGIRGWLTVAAAHKVVLAALSPQIRTLTHFLRGWVAPVIRKVKVLCYRLTCYYCQIWFVETEKLLPKWYLKSSSCCPFILAKNTQCAGDSLCYSAAAAFAKFSANRS